MTPAQRKARARRQSQKNERALKRRLRRESNLPTWRVKKIENGQFGLQCPRYDCGGKAVVNGKKWLASVPGFETRCCTYCYKTAWIPEDLL